MHISEQTIMVLLKCHVMVMNINALITFNFQARLFAKDSFSLQEAI